MNARPALFVVAALLAATANAQSQQRSMRDANNKLGDDPNSGVVIWEQKNKPNPAPAAQSNSSNAKTGLSPSAAVKAAEEPQPGGSALQRMFNAIREVNPPSGTGLNNAKKLDAKDQGIPLPGTAPAPR